MTDEKTSTAYLRLREDWQAIVTDPDAPLRSPRKDALFADLGRAWSRIPAEKRAEVGAYCVAAYH